MKYDEAFLRNKLFANLPMCYDEIFPESIPAGDGQKCDLTHTGAFILENGDVFFKLYAPSCRTVTMQIVINRIKTYDTAFKKGEDGFFELLLKNDGRFNGPLNLMIFFDGVRLLYPRLPVYWSSGAACNYVEFPTHKLDFCLVQDVPHGSVAARIYYSKALKRYERCLVYTPPGYDKSSSQYPVLYLQHGGGENETVWESTGKLSTIMDNAIAKGACVPFIVVMNNGMVRYPGSDPVLRDKAFEDNLLFSCIPFIEQEYRARGDKYSRAIAGLSMGAYFANDIALGHPELFAYVGAFTGCMYHGGDVEAVYPCPWKKVMLDDKGELVKREFRVFFQSATTIEDYINYVYTDNRICRENGVADMPGYRFIIHDDGETKWTSWRMGLNEYIKLLFREPEAYQSRQAMERYYERR